MRKKKNRSSYICVCVCVQRVTMNGTHEGTKAVSRKDKDLITKNGVNRDAEKCLAPGRNLIKIIEAATEQIITREETFSSLLFLAWKLSLQLVNCWIFSRREEEISIEIKTRLLHPQAIHRTNDIRIGTFSKPINRERDLCAKTVLYTSVTTCDNFYRAKVGGRGIQGARFRVAISPTVPPDTTIDYYSPSRRGRDISSANLGETRGESVLNPAWERRGWSALILIGEEAGSICKHHAQRSRARSTRCITVYGSTIIAMRSPASSPRVKK